MCTFAYSTEIWHSLIICQNTCYTTSPPSHHRYLRCSEMMLIRSAKWVDSYAWLADKHLRSHELSRLERAPKQRRASRERRKVLSPAGFACERLARLLQQMLLVDCHGVEIVELSGLRLRWHQAVNLVKILLPNSKQESNSITLETSNTYEWNHVYAAD